MIKNKWIMLTSLAIILCILSGCGKRQNVQNPPDTNWSDMVYDWTDVWVDGVKGYAYIGDINEDNVLIVADETWEEEDASSELGFTIHRITRLYCCDGNWENLQEIPLAMNEDDIFVTHRCALDGSGNILYEVYSRDKETFELVKIDAKGKEIARRTVDRELDREEDYLDQFCGTVEGDWIVTGQHWVAILNDNLETIGTMDVTDSYIEGVALGREGQILCARNIIQSGESIVSVLNTDKMEWKENYSIKDIWGFSANSPVIRGSGTYDFYYADDAGIYGYRINGKKSEKVLDYLACGMTSDRIGYFYSREDGTFIGNTSEYRENILGVSVYSKVDPATIANKETITFGVFGMDESIQKAVVDFNRKNKEYRLEVRDYFGEEDPISKMNADIAAGIAPDIWEISYLDADQYIAKGLLEDLTPYYERDEEVRKEDLFPTIAEALSREGRIYSVASSFYIYTMGARQKDIGEREGWNYEEMKSFVEQRGEETKIFYYNSKADILYSLLDTGITDFVDWDTGECRFDSEEFRDILEFCMEEGSDQELEGEVVSADMIEAYRENKVLFMEGAVDLNMMLINKGIMGDEVVYVGYPSQNREGSYFQLGSQLAISAKSEKKDAAWQFIRTFVTQEYQGLVMNANELPTRQDCYELAVEARMAKKSYTNRLGRVIYPIDYMVDYEDMHFEPGSLTQEDADRFTDLVNRTVKCANYSDLMMEDIIQEEAAYYFAGDKSLDDTIQVIQSRLELYMSEK